MHIFKSIHIYTYIDTNIRIHVYMYIRAYRCTDVRVYRYTDTYLFICLYIHMCASLFIDGHTAPHIFPRVSLHISFHNTTFRTPLRISSCACLAISLYAHLLFISQCILCISLCISLRVSLVYLYRRTSLRLSLRLSLLVRPPVGR